MYAQSNIDFLSLSNLLLLPTGLWHFNMSCLGVILQVRGCDGMSTSQNGVAAYSVSRITFRFLK